MASRRASWFHRSGSTNPSAIGSENPDDLPTGEIPVLDAQLLAQMDGMARGDSVRAEPLTLERALADRDALIHLCLYALDRARSTGVVQRLEHGLAELGITMIRPDGERFNPAFHEASGAKATDNVSLQGTVAETEVPGFSDQGRVLRVPIVIVYTP